MRLAAILIIMASAPAYGQAASEASNRIYRSASFLGRGDTGVAIADDEEAIFYNPAGIAQGKGLYKKTVLLSPQVEISEATKDLARELGSENANAVDTVIKHIGKPNHVGVSNFTGIILRRAAFGAIASSNVDLLAYKSKEQGGLEVVDARADQNLGVTFTLAEKFFRDSLYLGVTAKYLERGRGAITASAAEADQLKESLNDTSQFIGMGQGGGADVGLMWKSTGTRTNLSLGLTAHDLGDTKITPTDPTSLDLNLKQTIDVGLALEPNTKFSKAKLLVDYHDVQGRVVTNPLKRIHLGAEISVLDIVGVCGGLNGGYPTAGLYADVYFLRLDLSAYTEEVGERVGTRPDTRYAFRLKAGF